ncbi:MAG: phosphopentomutase [Lachnospiraceae bacterium]|nr:phosphopentomutase [Lachnospiraceae bacterium]
MMSRVIWIVLDSVGMGEAPDAADFGDEGCNTIGHIMEKYPELNIPNLRRIGYGNIEGMSGVKPVKEPEGAYGRLKELSAGKDTTIGHWEMAGIHTPQRFPVYPDGFPAEIIDAFIESTGVPGIIYNGVASGTAIINEYGDEMKATRKPIIYTSADSVFQIACDESVYTPEELYDMCRKARAILTGDHNVARVIARPYVWDGEKYVRTSNRRDFSRMPEEPNLLTMIRDAHQAVYAVGKIEDIFAGSGITEAVHTKDNEDGMDKTIEALDKVKEGLIFTNLVEFDSTWGHRRDAEGYAKGLEAFDKRLGELMEKIGSFNGEDSDDYIVITADHGCDPTFKGTDHTREYVPFLVYGRNVAATDLGTGDSFADSGETVRDILNVSGKLPIGVSRKSQIQKMRGAI